MRRVKYFKKTSNKKIRNGKSKLTRLTGSSYKRAGLDKWSVF